jgi:protocatechuate 3,4-dioxygenase beta subunit
MAGEHTSRSSEDDVGRAEPVISDRVGVTGTILDQNGKGIPNAKVAVSSEEHPVLDIAASSDEGGKFRLQGLVPGKYTLHVFAAENESTHEIDIAAGSPHKVIQLSVSR